MQLPSEAQFHIAPKAALAGLNVSQAAASRNLRLENLLADASSSSTTPSTSAASSPRSTALNPLHGPMGADDLLSWEAAMAPPGLAVPPQLVLPQAWDTSTVEHLSLLPPPGLPAPASVGLQPPPGLFLPSFRPPPGLPHPAAPSSPALAASAVADSSSQRVEWCIHHVLSKLKTSAGFALVSPPLQVGEIPDVRLHFAPGEAWAQSMRSRKGKKTEGKADCEVAKDSMKGSLRLKLGDFGHERVLKFCLFVGNVRQGPFECDFAERSVQEFELEVDWRKHVERKSESLCLRLELLSE